jgi:hypothetical protein
MKLDDTSEHRTTESEEAANFTETTGSAPMNPETVGIRGGLIYAF